jgi:hypothetical protein
MRDVLGTSRTRECMSAIALHVPAPERARWSRALVSKAAEIGLGASSVPAQKIVENAAAEPKAMGRVVNSRHR